MSGLARKPPSNRVVPPSWSSPVPNAGPWLGQRPAGCEVCREAPCCDESSALVENLIAQRQGRKETPMKK